MKPFTGKTILLDIEGTTSSVSYVFDVLFPYALEHLDTYLEHHWTHPDTLSAAEQIAQDIGAGSLGVWLEKEGAKDPTDAKKVVATEVRRLMSEDSKTTGLKMLQGLIWKSGFESGQLQSHVYDDVKPTLEAWKQAGLDIRIYSSGSVSAQKLFFGHTEKGDLLPFFSGHYDTKTGPKKEADSYRKIASDIGVSPEEMLFCSDVVAELDAANTAGMQTVLVVRPGNAPVADGHGHAEIKSLAEIAITN